MSSYTYEELRQEAIGFLAKCGKLTIAEREQHGEVDPKLSVNEMLGMATRIMGEASIIMQHDADAEEAQR